MFYSSHKQDEFLEINVFKGYKNGVFMDIGAHDGVSINNTLYFSKNNNWNGINIEPIKPVYDRLVENRNNNININCAVCDKDGTADFLWNIGYTEMISGLETYYDPRHIERLQLENYNMGSVTERITIETKRVETICDEHNITHINYLSIDVEGAEFDVIKSINFDKVFIDVIGFENNFDDVSLPILEYLESRNYIVIHKSLDYLMIHKDSVFFQNIV